MIPKIPIRARNTFDIRSHGNEPSAGAQAGLDLIEGPSQRSFVREVLEEIAGEDDIHPPARAGQGCEQS